MRIEIIPYKPYYDYQCWRALRDEGLEDSEMHYWKDPTFILADEKGDIGFVTFRTEHGYPRLIHFLVFKERRAGWAVLSLFKTFTQIAIMMGAVMVIVTVPSDKQYLRRFIKTWAGKDDPYAIDDDGRRQYLIPVIKGGVKNESLHVS